MIARRAVPPDERIEWLKSLPFFVVHLLPALAFFTGVRPFDIVLCVGLYYGRMFFISAGYHRYFAHRSYHLSRPVQFLMALGGATAAQKGALWWASIHRLHHRYSDQPADPHSPKRGFWWSHVGWILCAKYGRTRSEVIPEFARHPELRWLDRWHLVPPTILGATVFLAGGWSALWIGFFLSTALLWHGTFTINSLAHLFGRRRYRTSDTSRNSLLLALITSGEGWHNNHHYYQASMRNGFFWWELDPSYYVVRLLSGVGLARDLRQPPRTLLARGRERDRADAKGASAAAREKRLASAAGTRA
jgi:stearoyl-CoA desaturase (delta-9 desaturase)